MFWMRNKENSFQYTLLSGGLFFRQRPLIRANDSKLFSHFSTEIYVVGDQQNCLTETFLNSQNKCFKCWMRKYSSFYAIFFILTFTTKNVVYYGQSGQAQTWGKLLWKVMH